ncbi:MAG: hypothetical protein M5R36_08205 [Deltaproteobacteria bacterium]|nr:hypothetical protein [Deltaproteobacteria bacterium]
MKRTIMIAVTAALLWPATSALASLRGWHTDGQTFLVWTRVFPGPETYDVYVSRAPIDDLAGAELIGRVFPQEFLPERVRLADQAAPWQLPDGEGGRYRLQLTEG